MATSSSNFYHDSCKFVIVILPIRHYRAHSILWRLTLFSVCFLLAAPCSAKPLANPASTPVLSPTAENVIDEEIWLAVQINRQESEEPVLLLRHKDGHLLVRGEDLQRWRLRLPDIAPLSHHGNTYYPLDAMTGITYEVDDPHQILLLDVPAGQFLSTTLNGRGEGGDVAVPSPVSPGGFFNYDLSAGHNAGSTDIGGVLEVGIFNAKGVGVSNFLVNDQQGDSPVIRLETTWTQDRPTERASLRLGDAITAPGSSGRAVHFGGVQWATNFATQPGFVAFPLPGFTGEAVLPSTLELFVNNALRLSRDVPPGPFSIQDLPVITGQSEARMVVRDLLGREQIVSIPFYASPRLLQPGVDDFSYELGFVRNNYGIVSNDYGRFIATGTHRLGLTDGFTGEAHLELLRDQQTLGLGSVWLVPAIGVFSASLAASHSKPGEGGLVALGFERQAGSLSLGGNVQLASLHFSQLGLQPQEFAPKRVSQVFASFATTGSGSFTLSYADQDYRGRAEVKLMSANYSIRVGNLGFLGISANRILSKESSNSLSMIFTHLFGQRTSSSFNARHQSKGDQALMQVQRSLPSGDGFSYRLVAGAGISDRRAADLSFQNSIGTYSLETEQSNGEIGLRANISGGIVRLGGKTFMSRRIDESFAVVQVPDYPDVHIYADNQEVARTDSHGTALIPRLRPYQRNRIRIEQADLPLDAEIDILELDAVPYLRSAALIQFPVKHSHGALLAIVLDNGSPLPAGAVVQIVGEDKKFPTGLRGEVYLTGLKSNISLRVDWHGQSCEIVVPFQPTSNPLPHLGTYVCAGVTP